jgi:hypothetical protein
MGACSDTVSVETSDPIPSAPVLSVSGDLVDYPVMKEGMGRLARRVALALQDEALRQRVFDALQASDIPENKLHFRTLLGDDDVGLRQSIRVASSLQEGALNASLDSLVDLEFYVPVAEHRAAWTGDEDVIVVSFPDDDGSQPVGFDLQGRPVALTAEAPPSIPALVLTPVETDFSPRARTGGAGTSSYADSAWFMTYAWIPDTHEGWGMGSPEFEVHTFQVQPSAIIEDVICSGADMSAPYYWDMNSSTWSGNVMLATQAILDTVHLEFQMWEDDSGACTTSGGRPPKTSSSVWSELESWAKAIVNLELQLVAGQVWQTKVNAWITAASLTYALGSGVMEDDFVGVMEGPLFGCWYTDDENEFRIYEEDGGALKGKADVEVTYGIRNPLCPVTASISGPNLVYNCDPQPPTPDPATYYVDVTGGDGSISYQWYEDGSPKGTSSSHQLVNYSVGTREVSVKVTRGGSIDWDYYFVTVQDEDPSESPNCLAE